jgi:predicted O-methyltransferase YrrM
VLELGTSLGINTLYLAQKKDAQITTFEGAEEIADIAAFNFEFLDAKNIKLVTGNLQQTLPQWASMNNKVDFAFIDANHRYEPTLRYTELLISKTHSQSILVIDDIHRSADMEGAWHELSRHPLVYVSVDLFRCGILFFDPSLTKQKVVLHF